MDSSMVSKMDSIIRLFRSEEILVYEPGDVEYERSVAVANLLYRFSRPHCVVQPTHSADVQIIVKQAKKRDIKITIKNGGHSYAGFSTTDSGILLDLVKMKKVSLDIESETVTLQGGALWGHAYKKLVSGRYDGYIINGGRCPTVGVSGFILGGGLGPFTRSLGMGCDSLKEATIVTADGREVTVKDSGNPKSDEDRLFWALRGAGGGNFGVVVGLKMSVQRLQNPEGDVVAGRYTWSPKPEDMDGFMTTMKDFYTTNWEPRMTIDSSWLCDLQHTTGELAVRFIVYYDGTKDSFDNIIDRSIQHPELKKQLKRRSLPEKSTRFLHETLVAQWSEEIAKSFPSNRSYTIYSSFIFKNNLKTCEGVTTIIREEMKAFRELFPGEQGLLQVTWIHSGGEASKKKREATAFRWRDSVYHTYIMMQWDDKWLERDMRGFLQRFKEKLRPFSMMGRAAFINFPDVVLPQNIHERAYFGNNYQELQRIKKIWDKDNFFSWAQGVQLPKPKKGTPVSDSTAPRSIKMEEEYDEDVAGELEVNEQALTDTIASEQWETGIPGRNEFEGGVVGLTDLGF
ncbi:hypothetical protein B9Z19DRAFT_1194469 [Tuber borchii]|uniref:FAD-binding PCMH-type domain-containing protein n=1 Tax=Tuber borchii TaxID=42251 RepID=A0A2T6ZMS5_TUBBO|nr:hypothetical protein B9Z19DRAFT_1194469 [Tuber borchii]